MQLFIEYYYNSNFLNNHNIFFLFIYLSLLALLFILLALLLFLSIYFMNYKIQNRIKLDYISHTFILKIEKKNLIQI